MALSPGTTSHATAQAPEVPEVVGDGGGVAADDQPGEDEGDERTAFRRREDVLNQASVFEAACVRPRQQAMSSTPTSCVVDSESA